MLKLIFDFRKIAKGS